MRVVLALLAAALVLANPSPAGPAEPPAPTTYTHLVDMIVAALGSLPPTAVVNGVEVPTAQALALLEANAGPLPQEETLYAPYDAWGRGTRSGPPCVLAALLTAMTIDGPTPFTTMRAPVGAPGAVTCGALTLPYTFGTGGVEVAAAASSHVCLNSSGPLPLSGWTNGSPAPCLASVEEVNMSGRVGFFRISFHHSGIHIQIDQMFCGVGGPGPGFGDLCVVGVNR